MILEACVESIREAERAILLGARRLELCADLSQGGTTPSYAAIKYCVRLGAPVAVMIRANGGDFVYSEAEMALMEEDAETAAGLGAEALVFGALTRTSESVDLVYTARLIAAARGTPVVFHKAVDLLDESRYFDALDRLHALGIARILTSGRAKTALEGSSTLNRAIDGYGPRFIVAAGGITRANLQAVQESLPEAAQFHGKLIVGSLQ